MILPWVSILMLTTLEKRAANKGLLQERLGLPRESETPLLAMVSRMDVQKGVDLVFTALKSMKTIQLAGGHSGNRRSQTGRSRDEIAGNVSRDGSKWKPVTMPDLRVKFMQAQICS